MTTPVLYLDITVTMEDDRELLAEIPVPVGPYRVRVACEHQFKRSAAELDDALNRTLSVRFVHEARALVPLLEQRVKSETDPERKREAARQLRGTRQRAKEPADLSGLMPEEWTGFLAFATLAPTDDSIATMSFEGFVGAVSSISMDWRPPRKNEPDPTVPAVASAPAQPPSS